MHNWLATKMSGQKLMAHFWLDFVRQLEVKNKASLHFLDERLSSLAADALSGKKKDKAGRDEIAATIILQDYLDRN